jgi:hypothetical protein
MSFFDSPVQRSRFLRHVKTGSKNEQESDIRSLDHRSCPSCATVGWRVATSCESG